MTNLLQIKNLNVKLFTEGGILPVIDNVSMELSEGEVIGIVGESGCGKSMLASAIMGIMSSPARITRDFNDISGAYDFIKPLNEMRKTD